MEYALQRLDGDWHCRRNRYKNSKRCIFHAENKDFYEFVAELNEELKRMEGQDKFDFTGFVFPAITLSSTARPKTFSKQTLFIGATFQGEASFEGAKFQGNARFLGAQFHGEAIFILAEFERQASFEVAKFQREALFDGAKFQVSARFEGAEFKGKASFFGVEFQGETIFDEAKIKGIATFERSTFNESASFARCSFSAIADFGYTTFEEQVFFRAAGGEQGYLIFFSTTFKKPRITQIIGYPLSRVSFMGTDAEGILLVPAEEGNENILFSKYLENLEAVSPVFTQIRSFKDFDFLKNAPVTIEILIRILALIIFGNLFVAVRRRLERR